MQIQYFLNYLSLQKRYSAHTVNSYKNDLESFSEFLSRTESNLSLVCAKKLHVRNFIIQLSDDGNQPQTINRKLSALKKFYKYLLQQNKIEVSPVVTLKSLKTAKKVQIPFSKQEMENVLVHYNEDSVKTFQEKLIIEMLYVTGIRKNELIQLKIQDVNFKLQHIKVLGKRNKERFVPLSEQFLNSLQRFIQLKKSENLETQYLFSTIKNKKLYPKFVYNIVNAYFSKTSTKEKKSPHIIRHTFATHILNEGAEINSVKELLGHSSLASTQVYTHQNIEKLKEIFKQSHPREINAKN